MTKTTTQAAALALSVLMTLATIASMDSLATREYAKADSLAMASSGQVRVAAQHVAKAHLVVLGHHFSA